MKIFNFIVLIIGAGLSACSFHFTTHSTQTNINPSIQNSIEMDSLISPYRRELSKEFNIEIGQTKFDLLTSRTSMTLGFWVCDRLRENALTQTAYKQEPVISILNYGGFRSDIAAGKITIGDIYKSMPFDNKISYLKIKTSKLNEIIPYMQVKGGEPMSGISIQKGKLLFIDSKIEGSNFVWVVTSDFIANGGDKMNFLLEPIERIDTDILLRDFMIESVKKEQIISSNEKERITW